MHRPPRKENPTHPVQIGMRPVISALRFGKLRIAQARYQALCVSLGAKYWECVVIANMIRDACEREGIPFGRSQSHVAGNKKPPAY